MITGELKSQVAHIWIAFHSNSIELIQRQKIQTQEAIEKAEALFNSILQKAFKVELVNSDKLEFELENTNHA